MQGDNREETVDEVDARKIGFYSALVIARGAHYFGSSRSSVGAIFLNKGCLGALLYTCILRVSVLHQFLRRTLVLLCAILSLCKVSLVEPVLYFLACDSHPNRCGRNSSIFFRPFFSIGSIFGYG